MIRFRSKKKYPGYDSIPVKKNIRCDSDQEEYLDSIFFKKNTRFTVLVLALVKINGDSDQEEYLIYSFSTRIGKDKRPSLAFESSSQFRLSPVELSICRTMAIFEMDN